MAIGENRSRLTRRIVGFAGFSLPFPEHFPGSGLLLPLVGLRLQHGRRLQVIVPRALQEEVGVALFVGDAARHLARRLATKVGILSVFEMAIVLCLVVENVHLAALVQPEATDDDVVHRRRYFAPRIMMPTPLEA